MKKKEAILDVAGLISDAECISEGLLSGDLPEARFRASLIAGEARLRDMKDVQASAENVSRLLGTAGETPAPGYAEALVELSRALEEALVLALAKSTSSEAGVHEERGRS